MSVTQKLCRESGYDRNKHAIELDKSAYIYENIGIARKCWFHYLGAGIEKSLACMTSLCLEVFLFKSRHDCASKETGTEREPKRVVG